MKPNLPGNPFLKVKIDIDETFVAKVVQTLGGEVFDGSRMFPEGVEPVDFLLGGFALEYKALKDDLRCRTVTFDRGRF